MPKLVYTGGHEAVDTPFGVAVRGGEPIDVPADSDLLARPDFKPAGAKPGKED
jgi:hypothetical protein